jgi:hypothetical protein
MVRSADPRASGPRFTRTPLLFDLTIIGDPVTDARPEAPWVYYLVNAEPDPGDRPAWHVAVGLLATVAAGSSLGLLLAKILL